MLMNYGADWTVIDVSTLKMASGALAGRLGVSQPSDSLRSLSILRAGSDGGALTNNETRGRVRMQLERSRAGLACPPERTQDVPAELAPLSQRCARGAGAPPQRRLRLHICPFPARQRWRTIRAPRS